MGRRIKLLPRAEKELEALSPAIQDQIINKLELLREFPEMGPAMFDAFQGYRSLLEAVEKPLRQAQGERRGTEECRRFPVREDLIEVAYIRHRAKQIRLRVVREKK